MHDHAPPPVTLLRTERGEQVLLPAAPRSARELPPGAEPWDPAVHGITPRGSGASPPVYSYRARGNEHLLVVGLQGQRAYVVDRAGLPEADPWMVAQVLAYAFLDPLWRETMRHQRRHVWEVARVW